MRGLIVRRVTVCETGDCFRNVGDERRRGCGDAVTHRGGHCPWQTRLGPARQGQLLVRRALSRGAILTEPVEDRKRGAVSRSQPCQRSAEVVRKRARRTRRGRRRPTRPETALHRTPRGWGACRTRNRSAAVAVFIDDIDDPAGSCTTTGRRRGPAWPRRGPARSENRSGRSVSRASEHLPMPKRTTGGIETAGPCPNKRGCDPM